MRLGALGARQRTARAQILVGAQRPASGAVHPVAVVSTYGLKIVPTHAVYVGTKNAGRTLREGSRQESADEVLRTTSISPGYVRAELVDHAVDDPDGIRRGVATMFPLPRRPDPAEPSGRASCGRESDFAAQGFGDAW
ncbi:hypothetical protein GCM10011588_64430 [Nocardia jinanensis]|uniref:Uncharacterized protein n=1 Tax=Nocardia jinanensis TaxID=382504 RepID=A0A917RWN9_9NOCA|nr:hypothetical protein GCM10011588_64430 [Nocardia jinanensis]